MLKAMLLATAMVFLVCGPSALAQTIASTSSINPAPDVKPSTNLIGGEWAYPIVPLIIRLRSDGYATGRVNMDCQVSSDGHLTSCDVLYADPAGAKPANIVVDVFIKYTTVDPASVPGGFSPAHTSDSPSAGDRPKSVRALNAMLPDTALRFTVTPYLLQKSRVNIL